MLTHKLRLAATSLLLLLVVATGTVYHASARSWEGEAAARPPGRASLRASRIPEGPRPVPARAEPRPPGDPAAGRMTVIGRVLDPDGMPLPNARVAVLADRKRRVSDIDGQPPNILMGTAAADADGRFTLAFPAIPARDLHGLRLIATAPGRGLGMVGLKADAANQETSIALPPEQPVEGRLVDVQGQPAAGVVVRVARLDVPRGRELQPYDAKGAPSLWPSPATTDADGRFRVLGLGPDAPATFEVGDPRFARDAFAFHIEGPVTKRAQQTLRHGATVTLQPAQVLDFHVVHADDGRPVAGARIQIQSARTQGRMMLGVSGSTDARTDGQGRARVIPWPGDRFSTRIYPPEGEPYLSAWLPNVTWPKGAVQHSVEVKLGRGVLVCGRLIEDPAGTPLAGVWVGYVQTRRGNPRYLRLPEIQAVSGPDGAFTLVAPTGPGHLLVQAPSADYLHVATNNVEMGASLRPSFHIYPDAHASLDIKDGEPSRSLELRLHRGITVAGRVVAPDGKPVAEAFAIGRSYVFGGRPYPMTVGNGTPPQIEVKDGRFEIPGCDPEKPVAFYFLDRKDRLGATVELSGQSTANGPVTVRLRPTASASILLKRPDGKVPDYDEARSQLAGLRLIITPGPDWEEINKNIDTIPGDFAYQVNLDETQLDPPHAGPDDRMVLRNLIPGATYRFRGREFIPEPGQTVDLGEVVVEPQRR